MLLKSNFSSWGIRIELKFGLREIFEPKVLNLERHKLANQSSGNIQVCANINCLQVCWTKDHTKFVESFWIKIWIMSLWNSHIFCLLKSLRSWSMELQVLMNSFINGFRFCFKIADLQFDKHCCPNLGWSRDRDRDFDPCHTLLTEHWSHIFSLLHGKLTSFLSMPVCLDNVNWQCTSPERR